MAIEIVDLPSYKMVIFRSYVSLPDGRSWYRSSNDHLHVQSYIWFTGR